MSEAEQVGEIENNTIYYYKSKGIKKCNRKSSCNNKARIAWVFPQDIPIGGKTILVTVCEDHSDHVRKNLQTFHRHMPLAQFMQEYGDMIEPF